MAGENPTIDRTRFEVARVTIQLTTPLRIAGGEDDASLEDMVFVRDANGLPTIPGQSITGVLRHAYARKAAEPDVKRLFGALDGGTGTPSCVVVSWGQIHDKHDRPFPLLQLNGLPKDDDVLALAKLGVRRDHVRLNARGVTDAEGKFDVRSVPRGARFTFEIVCYNRGGVESDRAMDTLLAILVAPTTRLGGGGRRGNGAFAVTRVRRRGFDLGKEADRAAWRNYDMDLSRAETVLADAAVPKPGDGATVVDLKLVPDGFWSVGTGEGDTREEFGFKRFDKEDVRGTAPGGQTPRQENTKFADKVPGTEPEIVWSKTGEVRRKEQAPWVIPGASLKGLLRHRAEFHWRRARGMFAQNLADSDLGPWATGKDREPKRIDAFDSVFGTIKDSPEGGDEAGGVPGRLYIDDVYLPAAGAGAPKIGKFQHVSLDRFTQGPMDGMLFSEAALFGGEINVRIVLDPTELRDQKQGVPVAPDPEVLRAVDLAIDDLVQGRLAFGAHSARGFGFCDDTKSQCSGQLAPVVEEAAE